MTDKPIDREAVERAQEAVGRALNSRARTLGGAGGQTVEATLRSTIHSISAYDLDEICEGLGVVRALLAARDAETGQPMIDVIADAAGQKGTGRWTVVEALRLGQSASMIEAAVGARAWSSEKPARQAGEARLGGALGAVELPEDTLAEALLAARLLAHAQGFRVLAAASTAHGWQLDLAVIARIWRAGCIIRSALLDEIAEAFDEGPPQGKLILAPGPVRMLARGVPALREVVGAAVRGGHPVPALSAGLAWYDTMRRAQGSANLIQAQRDMFGRHGFARVGRPGVHHGPWWD